MNSLIVCGGKTMKSHSEVLQDMFLLSLKTMCFQEVLFRDSQMLLRYGFFMGAFEESVFIFGGLNQGNFLDGTLLKIQIES